MSPGEQQRVESLFGAVMDLGPSERARFLEQECGSSGAVRDRVERLLEEHERGSGILDEPLFAPEQRFAGDTWTGRVLQARYRIDRFLARGGMSMVYVASDRQLAGKRVIVKFLHSWALESDGLKTRFRHEMEALARIDHFGVVGVLDTGETADGQPFLVMEYIDGVTLRSEISAGPMAPGRAAGLIRQIARAVDAAHAKGVLHRDLKPENIMLEGPGTPEERVRLIDFGIARLEDLESNATRTTQFAGTTPYMAPEHLRGKPCPASDIYAMAVVAYEMLAGARPFSGTGPIEMYEQQRAGACLKPLLDQGISEPAARLIAKQLAFRPEERSASAIEPGEAIAAALLDPRKQLWSRRRTFGLLAAAGIPAAGGAWAWWRRPMPLTAAERVIELSGGSEPLEHGFRARSDIDNRVIMNAEATHVDALRLISRDQGGYYHPLDGAQTSAANRWGWKASFEAAVEEGTAYIMIDIAHAAARYLIDLTATPGKPDTVRLFTGYTPEFHGVDLALEAAAGARHRYVLAMPPGSHSAELWIDGVQRCTGYAGVIEYRYHRGPEIGVNRYRSARGVAVFWSFRFEIAVGQN